MRRHVKCPGCGGYVPRSVGSCPACGYLAPALGQGTRGCLVVFVLGGLLLTLFSVAGIVPLGSLEAVFWLTVSFLALVALLSLIGALLRRR